MPDDADSRRPAAGARVSMGCASVWLLGGGLGLLSISLLPALGGTADPGALALGGGFGILAMVFGHTLFARAIRGRSPVHPRLGMRGARWPLLLLPVVIVAGSAIQLAGGATLAWLPVAHVLAALLPALAVIAVVARHGGGVRRATAFTALTWGGLAAPVIAMVAEIGFALLLGLAVLAALHAGGPATIDPAAEAVKRLFSAAESDPDEMLAALKTLLGMPPIVLAIYGLMALLGPAIEELAKLAGAVLSAPRTRRGALVRGVAIGAGFGVTEAVFQGASPVSLTPGAVDTMAPALAWPTIMLARAVTTVMHATFSGVAALGWYAMSREMRWGRGVLAIGAALIGHGLWNGLILTAALGAFQLMGPDGQPIADPSPWAAALPVVAGSALIALAWTLSLGLMTMARRHGGRESG